jgi:hypothetical protein
MDRAQMELDEELDELIDQQCVRTGHHRGCGCADSPGLAARLEVLVWQLQRRNTAQDRVYADLIMAAINNTLGEVE